MKSLVVFAAIAVFTSSVAFAANPACQKQADEKKVAGAERKKFVKQCERKAATAAMKTCQSEAREKNLPYGADSEYVANCVKKATGAM